MERAERIGIILISGCGALVMSLGLSFIIGRHWIDAAEIAESEATTEYRATAQYWSPQDYGFVYQNTTSAATAQPVPPQWPKLVIDGETHRTETDVWLHWTCAKGYELDKPLAGFSHIAQPTPDKDIPKCLKASEADSRVGWISISGSAKSGSCLEFNGSDFVAAPCPK